MNGAFFFATVFLGCAAISTETCCFGTKHFSSKSHVLNGVPCYALSNFTGLLEVGSFRPCSRVSILNSGLNKVFGFGYGVASRNILTNWWVVSDNACAVISTHLLRHDFTENCVLGFTTVHKLTTNVSKTRISFGFSSQTIKSTVSVLCLRLNVSVSTIFKSNIKVVGFFLRLGSEFVINTILDFIYLFISYFSIN